MGVPCTQNSPSESSLDVSQTANSKESKTLASLIDHTLLKPEANQSEIVNLCAEAREWNFASVCINPYWVSVAAEALAGSPVKVCTVIGFPLGANAPAIKLAEAEVALLQGAGELDMVQNIGALRSGQMDAVRKDIADLAVLAHKRGSILKVILETCLLTEEQKITACRLAAESGADFVKTSTGFSSGGATTSDVKLMRDTVGPDLGVKASGGVRTLSAVYAMVSAGATRIGTSSGVSIMREMHEGKVQMHSGTGY